MRGLILAMALAAVSALQAAPTVTNVRASQRAGTKLVDIWYDVSNVFGNYAEVIVAVEVGGNLINANSLSGDVGGGIIPGNNRHVVWDAGTDWNEHYSTSVRVKLTVKDIPFGMVLVPAGIFVMGATTNVGHELIGDAVPQHQVDVSAFYMDKTEVTKGKWDEVAEWATMNGYDISTNSASGLGVVHPAYSVTWYECVKWCNARSQKEALMPCYWVGGAPYNAGEIVPVCNWNANGYRLPTEAEWEKAARGGLSTNRFPWGDTISHSQANYNSTNLYAYDVSPTRGCHPTYLGASMPYTSPAGSFAPNGYGLFDMAGNLWEWCWDWYDSTYYITSGNTDPTGPSSGTGRMTRGGSWYAKANGSRVAVRGGGSMATQSSNVLGFRCVRKQQ